MNRPKHNNKSAIKIKNSEKFSDDSIFGFQSIIGSTSAYNENVSIYNNTIEIDGYVNTQLPMISCNGENIDIQDNKIILSNPLEVITSDGPALFTTYSGINMNVIGNEVRGTVGRGFVVNVIKGRVLKNIKVQNDYEECVGEEIVLNDHPDQDEVN